MQGGMGAVAEVSLESSISYGITAIGFKWWHYLLTSEKEKHQLYYSTVFLISVGVCAYKVMYLLLYRYISISLKMVSRYFIYSMNC